MKMVITDLVIALEDLIKAVKENHKPMIEDAMLYAISTLGYDPSIKEQEYLVSLEIGTYAKTPDEAVKKFIGLLEDNPSNKWVYKTTDENDNEAVVDTYRW